MNTVTVDPFALVLDIRKDFAAGKIDDVQRKVLHAYSLFPQHPDVIFEAGVLYIHTKQWSEAEQLFRMIVSRTPKYVPARRNLALCLMESKNYLAAEGVLLETLGLSPEDEAVHEVLGEVYYRSGNTKKAILSFERAARLKPELPNYQAALGMAYMKNKENDRAKQAFDRAAKLGFMVNSNFANLGAAYAMTGRSPEACEILRDALNREPWNEGVASAYLLANVNHPGVDGTELLNIHRQYQAVVDNRAKVAEYTFPQPERPVKGRKIRIGLFSNDFKHHALGQFLIAVLQCIDQERFEIYAYSSTPDFDQTSLKIIPAVKTFADIRHLTHDEAAKGMYDDRPDVIIDLSGHTLNNRLSILARRPAPIILSWLGYLASTGLKAMDYHITDVHANPIGQTEAVFDEKFIRLPQTMYTYAPQHLMTRDVQVGPLPARKNGHITFGCFGFPTKMNDEVIRAWALVLKAVPTSKMLIYCEMDDTRERIYSEFAKHGIKRARIKFCGRISVDDYMDRHNKVDITLDTFPFVSGTTVADSLYMGVPMVSRFFPRGFSGQARSVLAQVGLEHHATGSLDEYVALAASLATDIEGLEGLRKTLRDRLLASPMMDAKLVTRHFESGLMLALERYWAGLPPDHINVPDDGNEAAASSSELPTPVVA